MTDRVMNTGAPLLVRQITAALAPLVALVFAAGCLRMSAEELYSLPRASEEYIRLQVRIDAVLNAGAEFSPPTGGPNRQSVQVKDLDGDGEDEALAFFSAPGNESPLEIHIFRKLEDDYQSADVIKGVGDAIESVRYIDMNGDGVTEIVVGWQMSTALQRLTIYSLNDLQNVRLAGADYTSLAVCDINGDGGDDVIAIRLATAETPGEAESLTLMSDGEVVSSVARLSAGVESVARVVTGALRDGSAAVFVDGKSNGGSATVTDVFTYLNGLLNISADAATGYSAGTERPMAMYCTDIDKDGATETPAAVLLPQQSETTYYEIDWYAYDASGERVIAMSTYHNNSDGWYIVLPESWRGRFTVRREDSAPGERAVVFSYVYGYDGGEAQFEDCLKIYTLSGDNKEERSRLPGRFEIISEGNAIYAGQLLPGAMDYGPESAREAVAGRFRLIYSEWLTGVA
jgi:hypothetical protein